MVPVQKGHIGYILQFTYIYKELNNLRWHQHCVKPGSFGGTEGLMAIQGDL